MDVLSKNEKKEKKVIGIIATSFHSDFSRMFISQICDCLKNEDVEIHLYLGMDASRYLDDYHDEDDGMQLHYFSLFGYSAFDDIDLMIISSEAIYTEKDSPGMDAVLEKLPHIPRIIVSSSEGKDSYHVTVDNYVGMRHMMEHLINVHSRRRIAFLSGSAEIPDAYERLKAYRDCVSEYGLDDDEALIAYGNFTSGCDDVLEPVFQLDPLPDAIVCANDEMAVCAYRMIRSHGLEVGKDISVTGFDDIKIAEAMDPPLTTVRQRFDGIAAIVTQMAIDILRDESTTDKVIPIKPIIRCSCGCSNITKKSVEQGIESGVSYLFDEYEDLKATRLREMKASLFLRSLLMQPITLKGFFDKLGARLQQMGVENSMINICEDPVILPKHDRMFVPDRTRLVLVQNERNIHTYELKKSDVLFQNHTEEAADTRRHIHHYLGGTWATFLLFYGDVQYGAWTVKLDLKDVLFYYALSLDIGSAMRYLYLALDQQEAHRQLAQQNQILDFSASHDELTGLHNRAGIMRYAYDYVMEHNDADSFVAVMADLDHLKEINDTFGHASGDYAIKTIASILQDTMPDGASIGRTGGDEFSGLFVVDDENDAATYVSRLKEACLKENEVSDKPFYVDASIGTYTFTYDEVSQDLSAVIKKADKSLYEAKKSRRSTIVK